MEKIELKIDGKPFVRADITKGRVKVGGKTFPLDEVIRPGFTAPDEFYKAIGGDEILAGRLQRMLVRVVEIS